MFHQIYNVKFKVLNKAAGNFLITQYPYTINHALHEFQEYGNTKSSIKTRDSNLY